MLGSMEEVVAQAGAEFCSVAHQGSCCASSPGIPVASRDIFMDRCVPAPCVLRRKQSRGGCISRAKSCQVAHQGTWKGWVLKQGLNSVKSRIREAAAQAHPESRPRPKTYSWTAAFVLRAPFAVAKCVACVSTCLHEKPGTSDPYTWNFLRAHRDIMRPKTVAVSHRKHMDLSLCAQRHVLAKRLLRSRAAR